MGEWAELDRGRSAQLSGRDLAARLADWMEGAAVGGRESRSVGRERERDRGGGGEQREMHAAKEMCCPSFQRHGIRGTDGGEVRDENQR